MRGLLAQPIEGTQYNTHDPENPKCGPQNDGYAEQTLKPVNQLPSLASAFDLIQIHSGLLVAPSRDCDGLVTQPSRVKRPHPLCFKASQNSFSGTRRPPALPIQRTKSQELATAPTGQCCQP